MENPKIDTNTIKDIHQVLMKDFKEEETKPGKLRNSQNWVGGDSPKNAEFVPPPHTEIVECLTDFEKCIANDETDTPYIVKAAMLHYQFETIHPFVSGNGRLGRMIVPLYLQSKGLLDKSCLYLSKFLEKNKSTYFEKLSKVRNNSDMLGWIKFFLEAVIETAKMQKDEFRKLEDLSCEIDKIILELPVKVDNATPVVKVLYDMPIVSRKKVLEKSGMKPSTLNTTINSLLEKGIIEEITGQGRNQIFAFKKYIEIFQ